MSWIQTYTGKKFFPLAPDPDSIDIIDIAAALSKICRFNGHCKEFYSVAQHSVLIADKCSPKNKKWALLHDAAEAYICDIPSPLKEQLPDYQEAEAAILRAIATRFSLPWPMPEEVKQLDRAILMDEAHRLMAKPTQPWAESAEPLGVPIHPWEPKQAETSFLLSWSSYK